MARKDPATLGVNTATRIAAIMTKTRVDSTAQLIPHLQKAVTSSVRVALTSASPSTYEEIRAALHEHFGASPFTDDTEGLLDKLAQIAGWVREPMLLVAFFLAILEIIKAAAQPLIYSETTEAWKRRPRKTLDVVTVAQAETRQHVTRQHALDEAQRDGYAEDRYDVLKKLSETVPTVTELLALRNRGEIDDETLLAQLARGGLTEGDATQIAGLRFFLPGPQDVVRFALRDMYRPEAVIRGGLLEDLPEPAVVDAERVGLTREEFEKYWGSHWVLPSVQQAFEMMHRGVISLDELKGLLRTQDIAPGWRDEMVEIAYTVISRVDIRRMYREGIASEEKVLATYLAQGYTQEDAEALTEFAIADATVDARELTKSEVIRLYQDGAMTRDDAAGLLGDLGFAGPESEWLLVLAEFRRFARFRDLAVSRVRSRYVGRRLSQGEASGALDRIGVVAEERDILIDLWDAERDAERPVLTSAMIGRLYRGNLLGEEEARVRWGELGYRSDDIDLLVLSYSGGDPESKAETPKTRQLTKSDIGRALREGTLSTADAVAGWMELGYTEGAAFLLARNYLPEEET